MYVSRIFSHTCSLCLRCCCACSSGPSHWHRSDHAASYLSYRLSWRPFPGYHRHVLNAGCSHERNAVKHPFFGFLYPALPAQDVGAATEECLNG